MKALILLLLIPLSFAAEHEDAEDEEEGSNCHIYIPPLSSSAPVPAPLVRSEALENLNDIEQIEVDVIWDDDVSDYESSDQGTPPLSSDEEN